MKRSPLKRTTPLKRKKSFKTIRRDPLDELFSELIRKRAIGRVGGCERCLTPKRDIVKENGEILPAWRQLQCVHFNGRARKSVRCDEDNAIGGCSGCHTFLDSQATDKVEFFKSYLGEEKYNLLQSRMRITYPKPDRKAIELYLRTKINDMETIDGNKPNGD